MEQYIFRMLDLSFVHMIRMEPESGEYRWLTYLVAIAHQVLVQMELYIVPTSGNTNLVAVNPDGTTKWSYNLGFHPASTPAIATDGTIYVADDGLYALNPDGSLKWKFSEALFSSQSPVIDSDGTIYWRESWVFYAINPDGTEKWKLNVPAPASGGLDPSPAIGSDGTLYIPMPDFFNPSNQYLKAYQGNRYGLIVTVYNIGTASGTVTSNPPGINCGSDCSEWYDPGTNVTLTPIPDSGSTFTGWSLACSGVGPCVVSMTSDKEVTARFTQQYDLTVTKAGTGSGTVISSPGGINCGSDCSEAYDQGTSVTLWPVPDISTGSAFTGWSGACSGAGDCTVSMTSDKTVTATFTLQQYTLTVTKAGKESGTVISNPAGINCGADCSEAYNQGRSVTLIPIPDSVRRLQVGQGRVRRWRLYSIHDQR